MNADHAFYIGNTHNICEDYSLSGVVENGAFAIVCDGCSQSPDVDFGARALALSAKRTLSIGGTDMRSDLFGKITIDNLKHIDDNFPLHPHSLDATLLVTWVKGNEFTVNMYGDGIFFHLNNTSIRTVHVDFESNTPDYLSYYLDKVRLKEYGETVVGNKRIIDSFVYKTETIDSRNTLGNEFFMKPFEPVTFKGMVEEGDIIGVISDGANSFRKSDGSDIDWQLAVREFIDFKSTAGVFVQRRLGFLKRQWTKNLINHYDDISMAAICI